MNGMNGSEQQTVPIKDSSPVGYVREKPNINIQPWGPIARGAINSKENVRNVLSNLFVQDPTILDLHNTKKDAAGVKDLNELELPDTLKSFLQGSQGSNDNVKVRYEARRNGQITSNIDNLSVSTQLGSTNDLRQIQILRIVNGTEIIIYAKGDKTVRNVSVVLDAAGEIESIKERRLKTQINQRGVIPLKDEILDGKMITIEYTKSGGILKPESAAENTPDDSLMELFKPKVTLT